MKQEVSTFVINDKTYRTVHIIIDGYNLIRQSDSLSSFERINLEEGRKALIRSMLLYKRQKKHQVTVVFDGWENGPLEEERDWQEGIYIIYSRKGEKADEVIKRIVQRRKGEFIVVTSDRDIANFVNRRGGVTVPSKEFESLVNRSSADSVSIEDSEDRDENQKRGTKKKGPSRRLSRKERAFLAKVKKL